MPEPVISKQKIGKPFDWQRDLSVTTIPQRSKSVLRCADSYWFALSSAGKTASLMPQLDNQRLSWKTALVRLRLSKIKYKEERGKRDLDSKCLLDASAKATPILCFQSSNASLIETITVADSGSEFEKIRSSTTRERFSGDACK